MTSHSHLKSNRLPLLFLAFFFSFSPLQLKVLTIMRVEKKGISSFFGILSYLRRRIVLHLLIKRLRCCITQTLTPATLDAHSPNYRPYQPVSSSISIPFPQSLSVFPVLYSTGNQIKFEIIPSARALPKKSSAFRGKRVNNTGYACRRHQTADG
jgi:hypothetical protein